VSNQPSLFTSRCVFGGNSYQGSSTFGDQITCVNAIMATGLPSSIKNFRDRRRKTGRPLVLRVACSDICCGQLAVFGQQSWLIAPRATFSVMPHAVDRLYRTRILREGWVHHRTADRPSRRHTVRCQLSTCLPILGCFVQPGPARWSARQALAIQVPHQSAFNQRRAIQTRPGITICGADSIAQGIGRRAQSVETWMTGTTGRTTSFLR